MSQEDKLEDCKKLIRSILIPYQRGCLLSEFNRAYMELIGKRLPIREFGFYADIEFLYSMPDVVKILPTRTGEYHLTAIPDEKSVHIQKMVARQKPSKSKPSARPPIKPSLKSVRSNFVLPPRSNYFLPSRSNFVLPPRFSESYKKCNEPIPKEVNKSSWRKEQPIIELKLPPKAVAKEPEKVTQISPGYETKLLPKASPQEEVIALVKYFGNRILCNDLLFEYERMYQKELSLSKYGFSSVEECVEEIPELCIKNINNCTYVVCYPESSESPIMSKNYSIQANSVLSLDKEIHQNNAHGSEKRSPEVPSAYQSEIGNSQNDDDVYVPDSWSMKLEMVGRKCTKGILSSAFPSFFEEVTGTPLDLHSLGYRSLSDLIDSVPHIFTRERMIGSKKDFIIYSFKNPRSESNGMKVIQYVITNIRKILQAYPEGITLKDFLHIYSINRNDTLCIKDFGFDDLETFLSSIKNQVPLKINSFEGIKSVHMLQDSDSLSSSTDSETSQETVIPFDVVPAEFRFKPQTFPDNSDFSKYFPVYTSSVDNPGHLHVHITGEETYEALVKLSEKIESFYNGSDSSYYTMRNEHIKVGAACVALWPVDGHWYRAVIISIPDMESVKVHYIDYGTRQTISKTLLRYMKKEFADLPAQGIRCRLAFLKPSNNARTWNKESMKRILELCKDVPLMAKVEEVEANGIYSIVLCDTNGAEDVYINDVLCNEGLADVVESNSESPVSSPPEPGKYIHSLTPLLALQAQYYLQAFITVAPSFACNENYIKLVREVNMCCSNLEQEKPNVDMPSATTLIPPGFSTVPMNPNAYVNSTVPCNTFNMISPVYNSSVEMESKFRAPHPPTFLNSTDSETFSPVKSTEGNVHACEIFDDDDDDEIFQEFCQKASLSVVRYVKRVTLGEGYKIHVIVVKCKPYASSGDISNLIWNNKDADYLFRRLQLKDVEIPYVTISENGNEELFKQMKKYGVKGIQKVDGFKDSILLHPLRVVIKILNIFGHPSVTIRTKLTEEIANFDPDDAVWRYISSPEPLEDKPEENFSGVTDDDKIEKLCLFDLLAMKESVTLRRMKLRNSLSGMGSNVKCDEMEKLDQLLQKVLQRIQEINEICNVFS